MYIIYVYIQIHQKYSHFKILVNIHNPTLPFSRALQGGSSVGNHWGGPHATTHDDGTICCFVAMKNMEKKTQKPKQKPKHQKSSTKI